MDFSTFARNRFSLLIVGAALFALLLHWGFQHRNFTSGGPSPLQGIVCNLSLIESAKEEWFIQHKKSIGDIPTRADLAVYMRYGKWIRRQANETYFINPIGTMASANGFKIAGKTQAFADGTTQ